MFVYRIQLEWLSNDYNALESSIIVTKDDQSKQTTHETSIELSSNCSDIELTEQHETKEQSSCED